MSENKSLVFTILCLKKAFFWNKNRVEIPKLCQNLVKIDPLLTELQQTNKQTKNHATDILHPL